MLVVPAVLDKGGLAAGGKPIKPIKLWNGKNIATVWKTLRINGGNLRTTYGPILNPFCENIFIFYLFVFFSFRAPKPQSVNIMLFTDLILGLLELMFGLIWLYVCISLHFFDKLVAYYSCSVFFKYNCVPSWAHSHFEATWQKLNEYQDFLSILGFWPWEPLGSILKLSWFILGSYLTHLGFILGPCWLNFYICIIFCILLAHFGYILKPSWLRIEIRKQFFVYGCQFLGSDPKISQIRNPLAPPPPSWDQNPSKNDLKVIQKDPFLFDQLLERFLYNLLALFLELFCTILTPTWHPKPLPKWSQVGSQIDPKLHMILCFF